MTKQDALRWFLSRPYLHHGFLMSRLRARRHNWGRIRDKWIGWARLRPRLANLLWRGPTDPATAIAWALDHGWWVTGSDAGWVLHVQGREVQVSTAAGPGLWVLR